MGIGSLRRRIETTFSIHSAVLNSEILPEPTSGNNALYLRAQANTSQPQVILLLGQSRQRAKKGHKNPRYRDQEWIQAFEIWGKGSVCDNMNLTDTNPGHLGA